VQGDRAADIATQTDVGQFTFDKQGNVWAVRGTLASAALNFHAAADFTSSGAHAPSRKIELASLSGCLPNVSALAFDAAGDLWVASVCDDAVYKVTQASLAASATVTPTVKLTVGAPGGLAFDAAGNLFVASRDDGRVWRFDAAQLTADAAAPAAKLGVRVSTDTADTTLYGAAWLAFDAHGALWFNDFGLNLFGSIPASSLGGTGEVDVQPGVRVTIGVSAVIENFAFDEQGGLWTAGAQGRLLRLSADQLLTSGTPVPERVITSNDIGSLSGVAVYPAPAELPLFHALP
jgi:sugar lactone lactonase YvrE